jgi:hypothetical protein
MSLWRRRALPQTQPSPCPPRKHERCVLQDEALHDKVWRATESPCTLFWCFLRRDRRWPSALMLIRAERGGKPPLHWCIAGIHLCTWCACVFLRGCMRHFSEACAAVGVVGEGEENYGFVD